MNAKVNKVRSQLLLMVDQENKTYVKKCDVKFNSQLPKQIMKDYEGGFTITFDNPLMTQSNKESNCSTSVKNVATVNYFQRCIKEIGKEFIDYIKIEVGKQKLESQNGNNGVTTKPLMKKKKSIEIDTELSFIETVAQIKSSTNKSARKRSVAFKFPNVARCSIDDLITDREEKEAKIIQTNFDKLQEISKRLKKGDHPNEEYTNLEKYANFNKFNDELFERLHCKGIAFKENIISNKGVNELEKRKSDIVYNPVYKYFNFSNGDDVSNEGNCLKKYKTAGSFHRTFTNDEYDTKESSNLISPKGKYQIRIKKDVELTVHEEDSYLSPKELSPIEKFNVKKKSKFYLKSSSIDESLKHSLSIDYSNNDMNLLSLIRCKKSPILRKDSENSKCSGISKYTKSPNTLSVISCSSVSEVSNFYELNCHQVL